ncbi:MAG: hypothetical protein WBG58_13865 [Ignavibacteriaceae bacterium]
MKGKADEQYSIIENLCVGGIDLIYRATYKKFNNEVVIFLPKIILSLFSFYKEALEFPMRKGKAIPALIHPNIITIERD